MPDRFWRRANMENPESPSPKRLIMLVDDSRANLLAGKEALADSYAVQTIPSAAKMFAALEWSCPELILLDVDMPEMTGFEAIRELKARPTTRDIPIIFLTAMDGNASELEGLQLGAVDYISKPFSPPLLRQRIKLHLLMESQKRELKKYNRRLQSKIITAMAEMVEGRDGTTGNHIANTKNYLEITLSAARDAGLWPDESTTWDTEQLLHASQLHDVGKITISDAILKKPGKLTDDEFVEMRRHVEYGVDFIARLQDGEDDNLFLRYAKTFAAYHHEKWDGSGYPQGLAGEDIPPLGRMMALADVYDALTSERPYKKAFTHAEAAAIILESAGTHFDPAVARLFAENAARFEEISMMSPADTL